MDCFCTLLYTEDYLPGALVLAARLTQFDPEVPRLVLITDIISSSTIKILKRAFNQVKLVEPIVAPDTPQLTLLARPELATACTKLAVWQQTEYQQIIYLDADTFPLASLKHLFNALPASKGIAAAPDMGWPDIFNSGVFVTRPDTETYNDLVKLVGAGDSFDGSDQGLLNSYFSNWSNLGFTHNVTASASYQYAPAYERFKHDIKVFHFIGPNKPWTCPDKNEMANLWRSVDTSQYYPIPQPDFNTPTQVDETKLIRPAANYWDPTKFEPPVSSKPEAAQFDESRLEETPPPFEFMGYGNPVFSFPWESKLKPATTRRFPRGFS